MKEIVNNKSERPIYLAHYQVTLRHRFGWLLFVASNVLPVDEMFLHQNLTMLAFVISELIPQPPVINQSKQIKDNIVNIQPICYRRWVQRLDTLCSAHHPPPAHNRFSFIKQPKQ